jgi:hypothetical protein
MKGISLANTVAEMTANGLHQILRDFRASDFAELARLSPWTEKFTAVTRNRVVPI